MINNTNLRKLFCSTKFFLKKHIFINKNKKFMKNILSSLNESEKKRILEMHKKATNRQYLTEDFKSNITAAELATVYSSSAQVLGTDKPTGVSFTLLPKYQQPGAGNLTYNCNPAGKYYSDKFQNIGPYNGIGLTFGSEGLPLGDVLDKMEILGKRQCESSAKLAPKPVAATAAKAKTPAQIAKEQFQSKMFNAISKYGDSDYFNMGELSAEGASTPQNPALHITLKNAANQNFVKVGAKNNEIYYCKTGWGGPNPFENNIKLEYAKNNYAQFKTDAGKTPASIAQTFVTNVCVAVGFPQK